MEGFVLHPLWTKLKHHFIAKWNPLHIRFISIYTNIEYNQKSKRANEISKPGEEFLLIVFSFGKKIYWRFFGVWTVLIFYFLMGAWKSFKINVRLSFLKYILKL